MTVEFFLSFWSAHNTQIIEVLIGLILLMVVYLAFHSFFGEDGAAASAQGPAGGGTAVDAAHLEKTLQKILEQQRAALSASASTGASSAAGGSVGTALPAEDVERWKSEISVRDAQIEELRKNLSSSAAAPPTAAVNNDESARLLNEKLKDLEARLSEYEIISEDIADLSFYKEENAKLQREVASFKTSLENQPSPAPLIPPPVEPVVPVASSAEVAPAVSTPSETNSPPVPASPPAEESTPSAEESQLMNQFENFVKKG